MKQLARRSCALAVLAALAWLAVHVACDEHQADPYDILGIPRDASEALIKRRHRELLAQYHPDKNSDPEAPARYTEIANAYDILSDPQKKRMYDTYGTTDPRHVPSGFGFRAGTGGSGPFSRAVYLTSENYAVLIEQASPQAIWLILFYSPYYSGDVRPSLQAFDAMADELRGVACFGRLHVSEQRYLASQFSIEYLPQVVGYSGGKYRTISRGVDHPRLVSNWVSDIVGDEVAARLSSFDALAGRLAQLLPRGPVLLVLGTRDSPSLMTRYCARELLHDVAVVHAGLPAGDLARALDALDVGGAARAGAGGAAALAKGTYVLVRDEATPDVASSLAGYAGALVYDGERQADAIVAWAASHRLGTLPSATLHNFEELCRVRCVLLLPASVADRFIVHDWRTALRRGALAAPGVRIARVLDELVATVASQLEAQPGAAVDYDRKAGRRRWRALAELSGAAAAQAWLDAQPAGADWRSVAQPRLTTPSALAVLGGYVQTVVDAVRTLVSAVFMLGSFGVFILLFVLPTLRA